MDCQKHVKVKSRWLQSSQMEMMIEESQSSLDMSDAITDVSTSDLNESTDYSSELIPTELRRSRRTGNNNRTGYRQLNGTKITQKKKSMALKTSNKRGRKKKQINTSGINNKNELKRNVSQELNTTVQSSVEWNNIHFQSKRLSKSVNNINEVVEKCPLKSIRRASLSWNFTFTPTNKISKCSAINSNFDNISIDIKHMNLEENPLKVNLLPINDKGLFKGNIASKKSVTNKNVFKCKNTDLTNNEVSKIELRPFSVLTKQKHCLELNEHIKLCDKTNTYQANCKVLSLPNLVHKKWRSKSLDSFFINTKASRNNFGRYKSIDCINQLGNTVIDILKCQIPLKKNRRQSKRIKPKNNYTEILDDIKIPEINYNQVADKMFREHQNQIHKARINDKEFDEKLKFSNFTLINENLYRPNRQTLKLYPSEISSLRKLKQRVISADINDYCECTLSKEDIINGIKGCNEGCLNRLLKVECGTSCSLKRYCTNKQFQNKQFQKTNIIKTERKGYGICAVEDIPKGVLISEYVGEVIDYNEMCNRLTKKEYKNQNYLVQLNPDEIIDSTSKGNVTRFINHSCDPNAVGEKWYVLGQSRIGFFSNRDIKKGEEITFDYSFRVFGNDPQICYCGTSDCRGYLSKPRNTTDLSYSEDSDDSTCENRLASKPEEKQRRKKMLIKRTNNDKNKLRELRRQLIDITKLKTGNKVDQEMATLNLNRLMVHTTDSVNRLHVLKFIQEQDVNKRLFMDFSGLSIIHNWMTSNENESFKLMILDILAELPITNRNTITKSKVLDVVAEWAEIPHDIKVKIESLEYPTTDFQKHIQEIDYIFPTNNEDKETMNTLITKARVLWKKWIVLKMVFKIPKKVDQPKPIEEINLNKLPEDYYSSMDISVVDRKAFKISHKHVNKSRNQHTVSSERLKLRKEFELKVEQDRQNAFRKKVMEDWHDKLAGVIKKKPDQNSLQHQQILNFASCDNALNYNGPIKHTRWDLSSQLTHMNQNSAVNYNMQNPCINFMPPQSQQLNQFPQYQYMQPQIFPDYHANNQQKCLNLPPPYLSNQSFTNPQQCITLLNKPLHHDEESLNQSLSIRLMKFAETNVFNLIDESLRKHNNSYKNESVNLETKNSNNKLCSRAVQSGADLLARIKVISDSFKKQPSKLIKINNLKQKQNKAKPKIISPSDIIIKSVYNENKKLTFINEQTGVSSSTLNEDLIPTSETLALSTKNKFSNSILTHLLKKAKFEKEDLVPKKFILNYNNSDLITCDETNKEIELYKSMKPTLIKKVVGQVNTKNGFVSVMKRYWGIKHKYLKEKHDKIPATKRNTMRQGSIHKISLKNRLVNTTKSALKKRNTINVNEYLKRPKEKRVTFMIEGETSPIFPHSEVRPINLNQNITKQKPLMKCHPFEIRNKPKSILQPSTSTTQSDGSQINLIGQSLEINNDHIITPIVAKFKASRNRRISLRDKSADLEQLRSQRKNMIPVSMMSLSVDVLKLIPDNKKEMKKVIDYYHSMATIIVKILGSYAKKTCQQGRIRSDDDFKYLAKKINENVLLKELQIKKVDKLKITNNTKFKVTEYIKKYMSRFGEVYKRKPTEQTNHQKSK